MSGEYRCERGSKRFVMGSHMEVVKMECKCYSVPTDSLSINLRTKTLVLTLNDEASDVCAHEIRDLPRNPNKSGHKTRILLAGVNNVASHLTT